MSWGDHGCVVTLLIEDRDGEDITSDRIQMIEELLRDRCGLQLRATGEGDHLMQQSFRKSIGRDLLAAAVMHGVGAETLRTYLEDMERDADDV